MIIGTFEYKEENDLYVGDILMLGCHIKAVEFRPITRKTDNGPDYRVTARIDIASVELGSAWKQTSEKAGQYLSVSLDGPLLPVALSVKLFAVQNSRRFDLVWNRKSDAEKVTKAA